MTFSDISKHVKVITLRPHGYNLSFSNILTPVFSLLLNSEGVIAYYWSQFDIPVNDLAILPEFSEERVLHTLEKGILNKRSTQGNVRIVEVTASCRYPRGGWRGAGLLRGRWHSHRRVL